VDEQTPFTELTLSTELTLFTELKPPVPEVGPIQARARARVVDDLRANRSRGRRFALRAGPDHTFRPGPWPKRRIRLAAAAAIVAVAAGAAGLTTALLPSGPASHARPGLSQPAHSPAKADWVVQRQPSGDFTVTLHELGDPAALQRALRAHGISAYVFAVPYEVLKVSSIVHGHRVTGYVQRPVSNCATRPWRPLPKRDWIHAAEAASEPYPVPGGFAFDINPAGIPHGASLTLSVGVWADPAAHGNNHIEGVGSGVGYGPIDECLPNR
jgi:hypothetical protein